MVLYLFYCYITETAAQHSPIVLHVNCFSLYTMHKCVFVSRSLVFIYLFDLHSRDDLVAVQYTLSMHCVAYVCSGGDDSRTKDRVHRQ